jgi:hypothetical protein
LFRQYCRWLCPSTWGNASVLFIIYLCIYYFLVYAQSINKIISSSFLVQSNYTTLGDAKLFFFVWIYWIYFFFNVKFQLCSNVIRTISTFNAGVSKLVL